MTSPNTSMTIRGMTNPLLLWSSLAFKTGEMLIASAYVIGHRTSRMAMAGPLPNARDRREFTLMGQEKIEAAVESVQAMSLRMAIANQQLGMMLLQQMLAGASSMTAMGMGLAASWTGQGQSEMFYKAIANSGAVASHISESFAQMAHHGLKPIYRRATSNSRRLQKF